MSEEKAKWVLKGADTDNAMYECSSCHYKSHDIPKMYRMTDRRNIDLMYCPSCFKKVEYELETMRVKVYRG